MRKVFWIIGGGLLLILAAFGMGICTSAVGTIGGKEIALVKIEGEILSADDIVSDLEDARKDPSFKAVVLRIDSPGGAVGASQEIYEEVKKVNQKKPVVVSMGDVAASGGYYIACGSKKILANLGTITGSIGVRMEHVNLKDLFSWAKIEHETLKSGKYKDIGAIDRPLREDERKLLEDVLVDMHKQFKEAVASARGFSAEEIDGIADGRVYTGRQALEMGLIDGIGGLTDAITEAGKLGGIIGEPKVIEVRPEKPWWKRLFFDAAFGKIGQSLAMYKM